MGSLLASLFTGNTGLHTSAIGVSTTGDNIANVNTVGHKASRAHFEDLMSTFIVGTTSGNQAGRGSTLQRIEKLFTQGSIVTTGVPTDMAINGDGFFVLRGNQGGVTQDFYSRAGQFRFDEEGFLVSQNGFRVQGFDADDTGVLGTTQGDLQITRRSLEPRPTSEVDIQANLRPDDPLTGPFDPANPDATSSFHTSINVWDSLGNSHIVDVYGTRTGNGTWDINALTDGGGIAGGVAGTQVQVPLGNLEFDDEGRLLNENIANPVNFAWNGAAVGAVTFDFGDPIAGGGTGQEGSTQWNRVNESSVNFIGQDGWGTGSLDGITIDEQGLISGGFTNGQTLVLGQVALSRFEDPTELISVGGNRFVETPGSGPANVGTPQSGGRGVIFSGSLEQSNVEISDQFIDLIQYQRAFQANSKTIQTADGLLQEVFQLIR